MVTVSGKFGHDKTKFHELGLYHTAVAHPYPHCRYLGIAPTGINLDCIHEGESLLDGYDKRFMGWREVKFVDLDFQAVDKPLEIIFKAFLKAESVAGLVLLHAAVYNLPSEAVVFTLKFADFADKRFRGSQAHGYAEVADGVNVIPCEVHEGEEFEAPFRQQMLRNILDCLLAFRRRGGDYRMIRYHDSGRYFSILRRSLRARRKALRVRVSEGSHVAFSTIRFRCLCHSRRRYAGMVGCMGDRF